MDNSVIGGQITKFRKAAGITQEELGRAVGVSTQAVSRWECGGTPDVTLFPAIADKLGVPIDALFGREGGESLDVEKVVCRWAQTLPREQVVGKLTHLIWRVVQQYPFRGQQMDPKYLENGLWQSSDGEQALNRTRFDSDEGLILGVGADDLAFMTLFPEPEAGYEAFFEQNDLYREFFGVLAKPGCLELLRCLYSKGKRAYVVEALTKAAGLPSEQTQELLAQLTRMGLLASHELELADETVKAYTVKDNGGFVPLMLMARCAIEKSDNFHMSYETRTKPWLRGKAKNQP